MMDNFRFDMTAEGKETLKEAVALAMKQNRRIRGYAVRPASPAITDEKYNHLNRPAKPLRLVLFWAAIEPGNGLKEFADAPEQQYVGFPFEMDAAGAADFAIRWLEGAAVYGGEPDHDGDNSKGWRVWNEAWGHVDNQWQACLAIQPVWAMHGK